MPTPTQPITDRSALEQSFADLLARHYLLSVSIVAHRNDGGEFTHFNSNVQWRDDAREHRRGCSSANGQTIAEVLFEAVAGMLAERGLAEPIVLADEPLPETV